MTSEQERERQRLIAELKSKVDDTKKAIEMLEQMQDIPAQQLYNSWIWQNINRLCDTYHIANIASRYRAEITKSACKWAAENNETIY